MSDCGSDRTRLSRRQSANPVTSRARVAIYEDGSVRWVIETDLVHSPQIVCLRADSAFTAAVSAAPNKAVVAAESAVTEREAISGTAEADDRPTRDHRPSLFADPRVFLAAQVRRLPMGWTSARAMRSCYLSWAEMQNLLPVTSNWFCSVLRDSGFLKYGRSRPNGAKLERGWRGGVLQAPGPASGGSTDSPQLHVVGSSGGCCGQLS
jgi:hypothetical protein